MSSAVVVVYLWVWMRSNLRVLNGKCVRCSNGGRWELAIGGEWSLSVRVSSALVVGMVWVGFSSFPRLFASRFPARYFYNPVVHLGNLQKPETRPISPAKMQNAAARKVNKQSRVVRPLDLDSKQTIVVIITKFLSVRPPLRYTTRSVAGIFSAGVLIYKLMMSPGHTVLEN